MLCSEFLLTLLDLADSSLVLLGATMYRVLSFMIFLSASIGPSVMITRLYNNSAGLNPLPPAVEPILCMLLIRCWAEFFVGIESSLFGHIMDSYKNRYPNTMTFGRFTVNFILYVTAFCQLYFQFHEVHTFSVPEQQRRKDWSRLSENRLPVISGDDSSATVDEEAWLTEERHDVIFLLSLFYLVFTTTKAFHKNILYTLSSLPSVPYYIFGSYMLRIGYGILHLMVNMVYFLPCLAIAYTARTYRTDGHTTYFQMCTTAALSGMIAALFELNKPWPRERGNMPFLHFENNLIAKDKLICVLISFILISYYQPLHQDKVPDYQFDSSNSSLIQFCLSVAFTVLHVVKMGVHAILSLAHDYDTAHDPQQGIPHHVPAAPSHDGSTASGTSQQSAIPPARHILGPDQMCQRCTENALNNNAQFTLPRVPSSTNNNVPPQQPPTEQGRHEGPEMDPTKSPEIDNEHALYNDNSVEVLEAGPRHSQCNIV